MTDDLVRLVTHDDHARGCEGREYSCACGYDERVETAIRKAAARIEALEGDKALFRQVFERLDQGRGPGHCHAIPGIWDNDSSNGDKAGTPCEWCALWSEVRAALTPEALHAD